MAEVVAKPMKVAVSVLFDVVHVELICGDAYAAQVLHGDLIDRLRSGDGIAISLQQPDRNSTYEDEYWSKGGGHSGRKG